MHYDVGFVRIYTIIFNFFSLIYGVGKVSHVTSVHYVTLPALRVVGIKKNPQSGIFLLEL